MADKSVAAAFDRQNRTIVAFTGCTGWSDVYLVDGVDDTMTRMWVGQVDAEEAIRKFEGECHPHMRPFRYVGQ